MERIKTALRLLLPTLQFLAALTPTKFDDAIVAVLSEMILSGELAATIHARMLAQAPATKEK